MVAAKPCKDCYPDGHGIKSSMVPAKQRPAPHPGPRCATHHRAVVKARKAAAAELRNQTVYGLAPGDYTRLYEIQGGHCAICQRATGKTRRLSVDHDHGTGDVRGLLCRPCNTLLGHARDDTAFFFRAYMYLKDPPARRLPTAMIQEKWNG